MLATAKSGDGALLLVGCGKMGGAMLAGWLSRGLPAGLRRVVVVDPAAEKPKRSPRGVSWTAGIDGIPKSVVPAVIVLAIKPQQMAAVVPLYARFPDSVFLSIAAGQTLRKISSLLGAGSSGAEEKFAIVRSMPNLPASVGEGISVAVANSRVTESQREICGKLLSAVGEVAWVLDESLLDPVTALSGSGPAYVFALVEAMASAGERLGLPPDLATRLARRTVIGSGALLNKVDESASSLRKAVTSPGGTTAAAMDQLMAEGGLPELMLRTMRAAAARSRSLAEQEKP